MSSQPITHTNPSPAPLPELSIEARLLREHLSARRQASNREESAWNARQQARDRRLFQGEQTVAVNTALGLHRPPRKSVPPIDFLISKWQFYWHRRASIFQPPAMERIIFSPPLPPDPPQEPAPPDEKKEDGFPSWLNSVVELGTPAPIAPVTIASEMDGQEESEDHDLTQPRLRAVNPKNPAIWQVPTEIIEASPVERSRLSLIEQEDAPATHHVEVHGAHSTTKEIESLLDRTTQLYQDVFGCLPDYHGLSSMEGLAMMCAHGKWFRGRSIEIDKTLVSGAARAYGKAAFQPREQAG